MKALDLSTENTTTLDGSIPFNVTLGWKSANQLIEVDHFANESEADETEIDSFAVLLGEDESGRLVVRSIDDVVFYNNKQSSCVTLESSKPSKSNYKVDPSSIPEYISKILFFVGAYEVNPKMKRNYLSGYAKVTQGASKVELDAEERVEKVMTLGELTRVGSQWKMTPSTEKMSSDVYKTLLNFGVKV